MGGAGDAVLCLDGPLGTPAPASTEPIRPKTAGDLLAGVVTRALDRSLAERMLSKEGGTLNQWSLVTLVGVLQTFIGLFMMVIAIFYLISSTDRTWRMAVVAGGGALECSVGMVALLMMRQDRRWLGLLVVVVSAGLELLFVVAMAAFKMRISELVVRIILLAHAGAVGASLLLSIWVLITANRAKAKLQRDLSLLDRMRAQHRSRQSFVIQSPIASHKIASVFRNFQHRKLGQRHTEWQAFEGAYERRILRAIVYATVCILILFLAFINLVYGIKFSRAQTTSWLLSVATGIFTDVVVNEPMTELLHAVLQIMLIIRKKGVYEGIFSSNAAIEVLEKKSPSHIARTVKAV